MSKFMSCLAAATVATLLLAGASVSQAADLSDPYDDPRYSEIYRDGPPSHGDRYVEKHRTERYVESYKDYDGGGDRYGRDDKDYDGDRRHDSGYADDDYQQSSRCVPRHLIRRDLAANGWCDFEKLELRRGVVLLRARRPSGRLFDLKLDRCTGHIIAARPIDRPYYERYAYGSRRGLRRY